MTSPLRGAEIDACVHRITLTRIDPDLAVRTPPSVEMKRRRREADAHRNAVLERLAATHPAAVAARGYEHTAELLDEGCELILQPRLADLDTARRVCAVQAFVRVGRDGARHVYAPLIIKNHEVSESASTRHLEEGSLEQLSPIEIVIREGLGLRSTPTVRRDGLLLGGALRILGAFDHADPGSRGGVIDRGSRLWWLHLAPPNNPKFNLSAYDELYAQRERVLTELDAWERSGGELPTSPYWHRECVTCEFAQHCAGELEANDDVSLTRFTSFEQQRALHAEGVHRRIDLARLDARRALSVRAWPANSPELERTTEGRLSRSIDKLDELIYRARASVRSSSMRIVDTTQMGCPTADVEVDVDMESYDDVTYLWGATVSLRRPVEGLMPGHVSFVEWGTLDASSEARLFGEFWTWFDGVRQRCHDQGRTFAAYCFWAQAEDGAMNRAAASADGAPELLEALEEFRSHRPSEWIDLHDLAKQQIQPDGPLGLKQLASAAGFRWRDVNPSGEASMQWYEVATSDDPQAPASRQRILDYNEDDCRATRALREWLNGPAQSLAHRDDQL